MFLECFFKSDFFGVLLARMASRKDKTKSKKVPTSKERFELPVNPDEPVHANWSKLSTYDFKQSRLEFNPYDFG